MPRAGAIASRIRPRSVAAIVRAPRSYYARRERRVRSIAARYRARKTRPAIARAIRSVSRRRASHTRTTRAARVAPSARAIARRESATRVDARRRDDARRGDAIVEAARVDARVASVGAASRDAATTSRALGVTRARAATR